MASMAAIEAHAAEVAEAVMIAARDAEAKAAAACAGDVPAARGERAQGGGGPCWTSEGSAGSRAAARVHPQCQLAGRGAVRPAGLGLDERIGDALAEDGDAVRHGRDLPGLRRQHADGDEL